MSKKKVKHRKRLIGRMRKHLLIMLIIATAMMVAVVAKLIYIRVAKGDSYEDVVLTQRTYTDKVVPYKRGDILDTNGLVLATSKKIYTLVLEPKNILVKDATKEATKAALLEFFDFTEEELSTYLAKTESYYEVARKNLEYDDVQAFKDYASNYNSTHTDSKVQGVSFEESYERVYPNEDLACHVIGYMVGKITGGNGLEGKYDSMLSGQDGREYTYLNSDYYEQSIIEPATDGCSVITTIDSEIQKIVQEKCEEFDETMNASNISVLVMDPSDCSVLAMYNSHQFDCSDAYDLDACKYQFDTEAGYELTDAEWEAKKDELTDEEIEAALENVWYNYSITQTLEPGSTYKTFTISGALEDGVVTENDSFYCDGYQDVADYTIKCHNVYGHGMLTLSQALAYSCNDALMQIAALEGRTVFAKYQRLFGFGQMTGIDLNGEPSEESLSTQIYDEEGLNAVELATSSFGQGVYVTMMQLCTAFCSAINGGYYYKPYIVKQIVDADGNVVQNHSNTLVRRAISEETSETMRELLHGVVTDGTARKAIVDGYEIGGKTGTAEKWPRDQGNYILSFIGFAPVDNPEVVIYCVVDEPHVDDPANTGAGTLLFNAIAEDLLPYMNIYRTGDDAETEDSGVGEEVATPVYEGDVPGDELQGLDSTTEADTEESDDAESSTEESEDSTTEE